MLACESLLAVLPGFGHQLVAVPEHRAVLHIDGRAEVGHQPRIKFFPYFLVCEKQQAIGVVRKGGDAVGVEISKERHCHAFVDIDVPEGHGPTGAVPRTDGDLAAFGNTCLGKEYPKLFDAFCYICIRI